MSGGIAIGPARPLAARLIILDRSVPPSEVGHEEQRLDTGVAHADQALAAVSGNLREERRGEAHDIVEVQRLLLRSPELVQGARTLIRAERLSAESAVRRVIDELATTFERTDDRYLKERGDDVVAVGDRLLRTLLGVIEEPPGDGRCAGAIAIGFGIDAVEAIALESSGLMALVTDRGGRTSHAAIIVRTLGVPYVAGVQHLRAVVRAGQTVIVDGTRGEVIVDPDPATLGEYQERQQAEIGHARRLRTIGARPVTTSDGVAVRVGANVDRMADVAHAVAVGAESIGLFRTEMLYLQRPDLPSEDDQYHDAVEVLRALGGRVATFRTLDLGGDKLPLAVDVPVGANPSLGVRAIRFSERRPDIFKTQLRALYRASATGPLRIMLPMVSGIAELRRARQLCAEVVEDLCREGVPYDPQVPIGAMIETPSAALTVDHLATSCDFFSIGTNDLIQYTFAADRENEDVDYLYQPLHAAILQLLREAIDAAERARRPLSVCGDMASDPTSARVLIGLGVRDLSMVPSAVPAVRAMIASTSIDEARGLAAAALAAAS